MGRWRQLHRDTASLEERRLHAFHLLGSGLSQAVVARQLGVTPVAVHKWKRALDEGGPKALRAVPRPGRPTLVPRATLASLPDLLARGALSYGFSTDLWTIPRILQVTEAEWGVRYTETAMWRLLKRHGMSWQRPRRQAREKDLTAVKNWRQHSWPRYKKKARRRRAVVVFVDESGFSLIPYAAKTWAPVGHTPVLLHQGRWPKFSAISGVTPAGRLYFRVHEDSIRGPEVIAFLRHLLRHIRRRPIMVFWDSGPHHRAVVVREYLEANPRLEVHRFPGYSPELNPDEWVWAHLKKHELASYAPHNVGELRRGIRLGVVRMRDRPALIRSFVEATHLYDSTTDSARSTQVGRVSLGGH